MNIPTDTVLKLLIDRLELLMKKCLGHFYEKYTEIYIEPVVLLAMLREVHYFYLVLADRFVNVSDCEKEAIEYLTESIDDLKIDIINMSKNNNEDKDPLKKLFLSLKNIDEIKKRK